jgi:hypothetical protein
VKNLQQQNRELMLLSPASAVWLMYADVVRGLRWRQHAAAAYQPKAMAAAPQRTRGRGA